MLKKLINIFFFKKLSHPAANYSTFDLVLSDNSTKHYKHVNFIRLYPVLLKLARIMHYNVLYKALKNYLIILSEVV